MANILIIGGAGYVGIELVKEFVANDDNVTIIDNFSNGDKTAHVRLAQLPVEILRGDIADSTFVNEVFKNNQFSIIYHLASIHYIPYCVAHPDEVFKTNYVGLQNVITATNQYQSQTRLVFASSASVYGSPIGVCSLKTKTEPNDIYGASKLAGEYLVKHQLKNYTIIRLFNVFGKVDPHLHLIPKVIKGAKNNENLQLGVSDARRDFIHVSDVARAFYLVCNTPNQSTYLVASGKAYSVKEVVDLIYKITESKGQVNYETIDNMRASDAPYLCGDNTEICKLGWSPRINLVEGLEDAVANN